MTNTREKIQTKVDEIGQEVLSAFIKNEQPKLMAKMTEVGLAWKEGDDQVYGTEGHDWLCEKFSEYVHAKVKGLPEGIQYDLTRDLFVAEYERYCDELVEKGDMIRHDDGNVEWSAQGRRKVDLRDALYGVDTREMTTDEVVAFCSKTVPGCSLEEMIEALRDVGDRHHQEADQLLAFREMRKAGNNGRDVGP